jgi:DNA-binding NarL/FixJ family response regulator
MILYMAADLIWATKIRCSAEAMGILARPVRDLEGLKARLHEDEPRALLVDLDGGDAALELIRYLRADRNNERHLRIRVVAWGPHTARELLQRAREAGAEEVLTRGALEHHMDEVLLSLSGRGGAGHGPGAGQGGGSASGGTTIL